MLQKQPSRLNGFCPARDVRRLSLSPHCGTSQWWLLLIGAVERWGSSGSSVELVCCMWGAQDWKAHETVSALEKVSYVPSPGSLVWSWWVQGSRCTCQHPFQGFLACPSW